MANYFVEGLQGSGKSTLAGKLAEKYPDHRALAEGDYSPVELSWCAYMRRAEYEKALEAFPALGAEIRQNSHPEADRVVVCYTKIRTDCQDFYKAMEEYEIYNNRVPLEDFKRIVLTRYRQWREDGLIVECSLFQNIVEELILFRCLEDAQILAFYRQIREAMGERDIRIAYIRTEKDDIGKNLEAARRERTDDQGREVWFAMLCDYFNSCPYAVKNGLRGAEGLIRHWQHRQALELEICEAVFPGQYTVFPSKRYGSVDI